MPLPLSATALKCISRSRVRISDALALAASILAVRTVDWYCKFSFSIVDASWLLSILDVSFVRSTLKSLMDLIVRLNDWISCWTFSFMMWVIVTVSLCWNPVAQEMIVVMATAASTKGSFGFSRFNPTMMAMDKMPMARVGRWV